MKGDFSRLPVQRAKRYSGVNMQQGRVLLDSDWNEQLSIQERMQQTETRDVVGSCGVPEDDGGFEVELQGGELFIHPGRMYVDGILCELNPSWLEFELESEADVDGTAKLAPSTMTVDHRRLEEGQWVEFDGSVPRLRAVIVGEESGVLSVRGDGLSALGSTGRLRRILTYGSQLGLSLELADHSEDGIYLAYADVWQRHVTEVQDPDIREPALRGPDTTTRTETVTQIRLLALQGQPRSCEEAEQQLPDREPGLLLGARAKPEQDAPGPCEFPPRNGYRRLENQLYRVEIHDVDGSLSYKWSRDNGSVVVPVHKVEVDPADPTVAEVTVPHLGRDDVLGIGEGQVVELLGDGIELSEAPGALAVTGPVSDSDQPGKKVIHLERGSDLEDVDEDTAKRQHWRLRRWDQPPPVNGAGPLAIRVPSPPEAWVELEEGVEVQFALGVGSGTRTGDYWLIPARTSEQDVLWPTVDPAGEPVLREPQGIHHHYCALALLERTTEQIGGQTRARWRRLDDCRRRFPPLTRVGRGGCCIRVAPDDDLRSAIGQVKAAGGGCVCLAVGVHRLRGPLLLEGLTGVVLAGEAPGAVLWLEATVDGLGGIVMDGCSRVSLERLTVVGGGVPAIVDVRAGTAERCRDISLREVDLLNLSQQESQAALRLAACEDVEVEGCRLLADVGILARIADSLTVVDAPPPAQTRWLEFPEAAGNRPLVRESRLRGQGVEVHGLPFHARGSEYARGRATFVAEERNLRIHQLVLGVDLGGPVDRVEVHIGEVEGPLNICVADRVHEIGGIEELATPTHPDLDGVGVSAKREGDGWVLALDGRIGQGDLAIGGQKMVIEALGYVPAAAPVVREAGAPRGTVRGLVARDTTVWYRRVGVTAAFGEDWHVLRCALRPLHDTASQAIGDRVASALASRDPAALLDWEDLARESAEGPGPALRGGVLRGFVISGSELRGARGIEAAYWRGGQVADCTVQCRYSGLNLGWVQEATVRSSRVDVPSGAGIAVSAAVAVRIDGNRIRAENGIASAPLQSALGIARDVLADVAASHGMTGPGEEALLGALLSLAVGSAGVSAAAAEAFGRLGLSESDVGRTLHARLVGRVQWPRMAVVSTFDVVDNELVAADGIHLVGAIAVGSVRILDNRIDASAGHGVLIEAPWWAGNVRSLVEIIRFGVGRAGELLSGLLTRLGNARLPQGLRHSWRELAQRAQAVLAELEPAMDYLFQGDLRVQGNSIHSLRSGIQSNLFNLVIAGNHVQVSGRAVELMTWQGLGQVWAAEPRMASFALAALEGRPDRAEALAGELTRDPDLGSDRDLQSRLRNAIARTADAVKVGMLRTRLLSAAEDLDSGDPERVISGATKGLSVLTQMRNDYGIWAKGAGARVVDNEVVVPAIVDDSRLPAGGIHLGGDVRERSWVPSFTARRLFGEAFQGSRDVLGVTEGLVDRNEVHGGSGHGVEVSSAVVITDVRITGNQIRNMLGSGVVVRAGALASGVEIRENVIEACGSGGDAPGIEVVLSASSRVASNRIERCAGTGILIKWVRGLEVTGNRVRECSLGERVLGGGVELVNVGGDVGIHENVLQYNQGVQLRWEDAGVLSLAITVSVLSAVHALLPVGLPGPVGRTRTTPVSTDASVVGNVLRSRTREQMALNLVLVPSFLTFAENRIETSFRLPVQGRLHGQFELLVLANNRFSRLTENAASIEVSRVARGTISGNAGWAPIRVYKVNAGAVVDHNVNVPPAEVI